MEEVLLRPDAGEETPSDEATGAWPQVVGRETGQGLAVQHEARPPTFQLNLTQQARDLHTVHLVGSRDNITSELTSLLLVTTL